ncbi:hypothetical protein KCP69_12565 [Salmonella enterica subsp. enterica]|nr:hypothetical protein KCP69_12565 [Salmonella enterica subsp. enterica]
MVVQQYCTVAACAEAHDVELASHRDELDLLDGVRQAFFAGAGTNQFIWRLSSAALVANNDVSGGFIRNMMERANIAFTPPQHNGTNRSSGPSRIYPRNRVQPDGGKRACNAELTN